MVSLALIVEALNRRKARILDVAAVGLPSGQFEAFRKVVLDELGRDGFEGECRRLLADGKAREGSGPADTCKKGGVP